MKKMNDFIGRHFRCFLYGLIAIIILLIGGFGAYTHYYPPIDRQHQIPMSKIDPQKDPVEVAGVLAGWVYDHSTKISRRTAMEIVREALKTNKPLFILALSAVESEFVQSAVSNVGAKGLTQVMWKVWGQALIKAGIAKEERDLFDIDVSVKAGNYILDILLAESNGDVAKTLEKYLGGRDGYYKNRITENLANLYVRVNVPSLQKKAEEPEMKKSEAKKAEIKRSE